MFKKREDKIIIALIVIILAFIMFTCICLFEKTNKSGVLLESGDAQKVLNQYVLVKGYSELYFNSDEEIQEFDFSNPKTNDCYMNISFSMPDGQLLFKVERIEPGYGIKEVQLNKVLKNGNYLGCKFVVDCYSMQDDSQLNGATMSIDLYVG